MRAPRSEPAGWPPDVPSDEPHELDQLIPLVYHELREMAHRELQHDQPGHTLSTTDLVHEAYLRLSRDPRVTAKGKGYFFAAAAQAMRRIVVDFARRKRRLKRGGAIRLTTLQDDQPAADQSALEVLELEEALTKLAAIAPRAARVVECRFYGGLDLEQTALAVGVTTRTVKRDWTFARAWLFDHLHGRAQERP